MIYQQIIYTDKSESMILVGESYQNLSAYLPEGKQVIVITDANIMAYYGDFLKQYPVIEIGTGEQNKNIDTIVSIYDHLLRLNADRHSFIVAVGGGIVCDVAGFAVSTFMRGIPFGFVSTTLLAQVDASVGGKNGINFGGFKNMVGTFNQPRFVLCDTDMIRTLPSTEFISGFAEIIKSAAIRNVHLFEYLEQNVEKALAGDREVLQHLVIESIKIKAEIVENDEHEQGERKILNFGHTFGHAIEVQTGVSHGFAVSVGMVIAARWSVYACGFPEDQLCRLERLLMAFGLPTTTTATREEILHALLKDKKREKDSVSLILLKEIGVSEIRKTPISEIEEKIEKVL